MLGHIAIASMGGCFSQNPNTGAAEATYFPAESVIINTSIVKSSTREAGTTDFLHGFTETEIWIKAQALSYTMSGFPSFARLGTVQAGEWARAWFMTSLNPAGVVHYVNEGSTIVSKQLNPTIVFTTQKQTGEDVSRLRAADIDHTGTTEDSDVARASSDWFFQTGTDSRITSCRFWGDFMRNDYYGVRWRRLPMQCAERNSIALYDTDGKQLVEY